MNLALGLDGKESRSLGGRQACLLQDYVQAVIYLSTEGFRAATLNRKLFPSCCKESTQFTPLAMLA